MTLHPGSFKRLKDQGRPITMLTAYDFTTAGMLDQSDVDGILVGDSLGSTFAGERNTIPVTMTQMVYHTQVVARAVSASVLVADMPFMSYEISMEEAKRNAGRLIKEGGAKAVKIEVGSAHVSTVKAIVDMGIPVMGHLGLTPQSIYQLGGHRVQGRSKEDADRLLDYAKQLQDVGCFSVLVELIPADLGRKMSLSLDIPVIGIGAGSGCDGQILVTDDILGLSDGKSLSFVKRYASLRSDIMSSIASYCDDVRQSRFPSSDHEFE